MKVPIPCEFGEKALCKNRMLPFAGVSWFKWTEGIEYTYFFTTSDSWHMFDFYSTFQNEQKQYIEVPDSLLLDGFIKEKGFPLKGRGYATGISYKDEKFYIDFIITSNYLSHIKIQCNEHCAYVHGGDIIFPPSWDTEEKKERAILKSIKIIKGQPLEIKPPEPIQLSLFDFISN